MGWSVHEHKGQAERERRLFLRRLFGGRIAGRFDRAASEHGFSEERIVDGPRELHPFTATALDHRAIRDEVAILVDDEMKYSAAVASSLQQTVLEESAASIDLIWTHKKSVTSKTWLS